MTSTEPYSLRNGLGFRFGRLSKVMQNRLDSALLPLGITRLKWCALSGIGLEHITTPSGLAANIGITRQATSRLLLQMTKDGLIERSLDVADGRARHIELTTLGKEKLDACLPLVTENQIYFANKLSPEQVDQLSALVNTMLEGEDAEFDRI